MFLSYEYIRNLGYDKKTGKFRFEYKIVDTDFEEVGVGVDVEGSNLDVGVGAEVIETYRKRNLPVVSNLILFWQYYAKKYDHSFEDLIRWSKQYNLFHAEYEEEIDKYLLLI